MFGEEFLKNVDAESRPPPSVERAETSESTSIVLEARGNLSPNEINLTVIINSLNQVLQIL